MMLTEREQELFDRGQLKAYLKAITLLNKHPANAVREMLFTLADKLELQPNPELSAASDHKVVVDKNTRCNQTRCIFTRACRRHIIYLALQQEETVQTIVPDQDTGLCMWFVGEITVDNVPEVKT